MTEEEKPIGGGEWEKKNIGGNSAQLLKLATKLAEFHRLTIEQKLREMKSHVSVECLKLNHPSATEFADEINKIQVNNG
jgi:hypothetical protein